ncbi:polar amino acid transport system substrate-binding protein [Azospirillum agricola]|uniref:substrate-binding periplasmic protein n=2 Tax=Azospirillum agricola TaxID=1720247 RepID=UPI001F42DDBF|nr:transporter substrate-binding domain-containing protein [Azospirillum agricola]MBP2227814.1 polar amino acid transport system substrate-binding protein [Azospirillum agricola]
MAMTTTRLLAALLLALFAAAALAAAPARAEYWTIASEDHFPPYNYSFNGKRTGIDTEIVAALVKELGITPVYRPLSWSEVVRSMDENTADVGFQFIASPARFAQYNMIGPFRTGTTVFMVRKDSSITFDRLEDLTPYRIGVVDGFSYAPDFDAATYLEKVASSSNVVNFRRLMLGRVDVIVGDLHVLNFMAKQDGRLRDVRVLSKPLGLIPRYIALPKARKEKAEKLQAAFVKLRDDGTIARIVDSWLAE